MHEKRERLEAILRDLGPASIAVSGGVDSMTLAVLAHRIDPRNIAVVHAVSPAVPPEATERVRDWAVREGWRLTALDAGEFDDPDYRRNPVNRCFFCKRSLYSAIASRIGGTIASGTNKDDLGDYRPGLDAARSFHVRHPYVEAEIGKTAVRALARELGLGGLAELPASPCLSSRIETAIPIDPQALRLVHQVEQLVSHRLRPQIVRCRVRSRGLVIELDDASFERFREVDPGLSNEVEGLLKAANRTSSISFARYQRGSAFLGAPVL
jgi:pyridinium-3,5-biscarboxylic acid mononucleotide sulfurtransferase